MSLSANPFNVAYLPYLGQDSPNPRNTFYRRRAPTNSDRRLYKVGDRWIDTASQIAYILVGKTATTANWVQMSGGGAGVTSLNGLVGALSIIDQLGLGAITVTVPGSGGATTIGLTVNVDGVTIQRVGDQLVAGGSVATTYNGNVGSATPALNVLNVVGGAGSGITVTGAGNTLTFTFTNGLPASTFTVDAAVAPGVNPVVPSAGGNVNVFGTSVASVGIPVQTVTRAVNSYNVEVQLASQQAVSSATNAGLASFDSSDFTVDANGFVSALGFNFPWTDEPAPFAASVFNGYFVTAAVTGTLPAAVQGDIIEIVDTVGGGIVVQANGGQTIEIGNTSTSVGGTITSTQKGDAVRLVFRAADSTWYSVPTGQAVWIFT